MNKRQAENYRRTVNALCNAGIPLLDCYELFRIESRLQKWGEHLCNDTWTDDDGIKAFRHGWNDKPYRVPNPEPGLLRRLAVIMAPHRRRLIACHQGDPRGCALYIVPRKLIPKGESVNAFYTRGIAVCY